MFHSFAEGSETPGDKRLFAPSAARNVTAICEVLASKLPKGGLALEIASGTGEHVIAFAALNPALLWQPTDIDPERVESINAWRAQTGATNVLEALEFDASTSAWEGQKAQFAFVSNLLHLVSRADAEAVLTTMIGALGPGGLCAIYGPFLRSEGFASEADAQFDASIRTERPLAGYKLIDDVEAQLSSLGLVDLERVTMPANNLMVLGHKR